MSKYFLDTEFIEGFHKPLFGKKRHHIDLISIGLYCEDGRTFYKISSEYDYKDADGWVRENVILPAYKHAVHGDARNHYTAQNFHKLHGFPNGYIRGLLLDFFALDKTPIEIYGYFSDYDWVLFCSIFGTMIELPKGYPMYCIDLKQMMMERGLDSTWKRKACPDPEDEHNALADAKWNYRLYTKIIETDAAK